MSSAKSFLARHARVLAVAVSCAGLGAGAGVISSAGAASSSPGSATSSATASSQSRQAAHAGAHRARPLAWRRAVYGAAVQGDLVVDTKSGWKTVTFERGFVDSVSGNTLTLREATRKATYKTVTVTIPDGAHVRNQGRPSTLSQLTSGEHVLVLQGPAQTLVVARAAGS